MPWVLTTLFLSPDHCVSTPLLFFPIHTRYVSLSFSANMHSCAPARLFSPLSPTFSRALSRALSLSQCLAPSLALSRVGSRTCAHELALTLSLGRLIYIHISIYRLIYIHICIYRLIYIHICIYANCWWLSPSAGWGRLRTRTTMDETAGTIYYNSLSLSLSLSHTHTHTHTHKYTHTHTHGRNGR